MNKVLNWVTYGLIVLSAVRCNASKETETVKTPSQLRKAVSFFLKRVVFSPMTLPVGLMSFAISEPSKSNANLVKFALIMGGITSAFITCIRLLDAQLHLTHDHTPREPISLNSFINTYGAHILAIIAGDRLRHLYNTCSLPNKSLPITCTAALLAALV